ncbi:MAG: tetraacyldisaccharide 4'-kinase [Succinivibrio sp.]|nr:tetraacyldisaccharide 4'-kinase [Succinivibrio sp.]
MSAVDRLWYGRKTLAGCALHLPLLPLSWIFGAVSAARRTLYAGGRLKSDAPEVPVVIVGGITAGGSGKTPLCAALLKKLSEKGFHPGLISRGYRGKAPSYPFIVHENSDPAECGDEPLLLKRKVGELALVAVDPDRVRGAFALAELGCDVVVCDDGMQHYALRRDCEILVVDAVRQYGNGHLLPCGPLREGIWRAGTVDAIVYNGAGAVRVGGYSMTLVPRAPEALDGEKGRTLQRGTAVCALAGIGNPGRFFATLRDLGLNVQKTLRAGDHGRVDERRLLKAAEELPVVMTCKDAVKYQDLKGGNLFCVDVDARLNDNFYNTVLARIRDAKSPVSKRAEEHRRKRAQNSAEVKRK